MSKTHSKFLLTGFGPFPGVPHNVSSAFAKTLADTAARCFRQVEFEAACLPTVWQEAPLQLERLYYLHRPTIALHFGVSHMAKTIVVETTARNCTGRPDALGVEPDQEQLLPGGASAHSASVPVGRLVARLRNVGVPAVVSHDAGAYLCNNAYYTAAHEVERLGLDSCVLFIHIPLPGELKDGADLCLAEIERAVRLIMRWLLDTR